MYSCSFLRCSSMGFWGYLQKIRVADSRSWWKTSFNGYSHYIMIPYKCSSSMLGTQLQQRSRGIQSTNPLLFLFMQERNVCSMKLQYIVDMRIWWHACWILLCTFQFKWRRNNRFLHLFASPCENPCPWIVHKRDFLFLSF